MNLLIMEKTHANTIRFYIILTLVNNLQVSSSSNIFLEIRLAKSKSKSLRHLRKLEDAYLFYKIAKKSNT